MFVSAIRVSNLRAYPADPPFVLEDINIPDGTHEGSGLTVFLGENACGKTTLLDAIALSLLPYKADGFAISDFNDPNNKVSVSLFSEEDFEVASTMPNGSFKSKGFHFGASVRSKKNKAYLSSSIVNDQTFIKADGETKPKDWSPDLRVNVNNPYKGKRFDENDVLYLDRNRTYQIRSGTFNSTKFDRVTEDLNYQYVKGTKVVPDLNSRLEDVLGAASNDLLNAAREKFLEVSGIDVSLDLVNNWSPFSKGFLNQKMNSHLQVSLESIGSGYEMIFSLIYSFQLAKQSGKQLILLIDEPELHLHPAVQAKFVELLLEYSRDSQIFITSHSPLLVKQLFYCERVKYIVLRRINEEIETSPIEDQVLSYVSANEVNFLAFDLPTEEYHNELYEELKTSSGYTTAGIKDFDRHYFVGEKHEPQNSPWMGHPNAVSEHTYLRNQIHHRADNGQADIERLHWSICRMRALIQD